MERLGAARQARGGQSLARRSTTARARINGDSSWRGFLTQPGPTARSPSRPSWLRPACPPHARREAGRPARGPCCRWKQCSHSGPHRPSAGHVAADQQIDVVPGWANRAAGAGLAQHRHALLDLARHDQPATVLAERQHVVLVERDHLAAGLEGRRRITPVRLHDHQREITACAFRIERMPCRAARKARQAADRRGGCRRQAGIRGCRASPGT